MGQAKLVCIEPSLGWRTEHGMLGAAIRLVSAGSKRAEGSHEPRIALLDAVQHVIDHINTYLSMTPIGGGDGLEVVRYLVSHVVQPPDQWVVVM